MIIKKNNNVFSQTHFSQAFFKSSEDDEVLRERLQEDKLVFFLHLLGIDTNGHSKKPYSE